MATLTQQGKWHLLSIPAILIYTEFILLSYGINLCTNFRNGFRQYANLFLHVTLTNHKYNIIRSTTFGALAFVSISLIVNSSGVTRKLNHVLNINKMVVVLSIAVFVWTSFKTGFHRYSDYWHVTRTYQRVDFFLFTNAGSLMSVAVTLILNLTGLMERMKLSFRTNVIVAIIYAFWSCLVMIASSVGIAHVQDLRQTFVMLKNNAITTDTISTYDGINIVTHTMWETFEAMVAMASAIWSCLVMLASSVGIAYLKDLSKTSVMLTYNETIHKERNICDGIRTVTDTTCETFEKALYYVGVPVTILMFMGSLLHIILNLRAPEVPLAESQVTTAPPAIPPRIRIAALPAASKFANFSPKLIYPKSIVARGSKFANFPPKFIDPKSIVPRGSKFANFPPKFIDPKSIVPRAPKFANFPRKLIDPKSIVPKALEVPLAESQVTTAPPAIPPKIRRAALPAGSQLAYSWQFRLFGSNDCWKEVNTFHNKYLEQAYSDPANDTATFTVTDDSWGISSDDSYLVFIDFERDFDSHAIIQNDFMTQIYFHVRRLSADSYDNLTVIPTIWEWFWKGDDGRWNKYVKEYDVNPVSFKKCPIKGCEGRYSDDVELIEHFTVMHNDSEKVKASQNNRNMSDTGASGGGLDSAMVECNKCGLQVQQALIRDHVFVCRDDQLEVQNSIGSYEIEQAFQNGNDDISFYRKQFWYKIDFKQQQELQQTLDLRYFDKRETRRRPVFQSVNAMRPDGNIFPTQWPLIPENQEYVRLSLNSISPEYKFIEQKFLKSISASYFNYPYQYSVRFRVVKIDSIHNNFLYGNFCRKRIHMEKKVSATQVGALERQLYHGTRHSNIDSICKTNFDWRRNGTNATNYGKGCYFVRDAYYSHKFVEMQRSGSRFMFLADILVGEYTKGHPTFKVPPRRCSQNEDLFDSCVNSIINPAIFVVFDINQMYPKYLIEYKYER